MRHKSFALLLAAVLSLPALDITAVAAEAPGGFPLSAAPDLIISAAPADAVPQGGAPGQSAPYVPDPAGSLSFDNLERRMREGNLNMLALEENIQFFKSYDYDEMTEDVRKGLNEIASLQWGMIAGGPSIDLGPGMEGINSALSGIMSAANASASQQLQLQYDALREQFDKLKNGEFQEDMEDLIWQLENAQDQLIMAGQSMYIAVTTMEQSGQAVSRGLETMDRTLTELELRHQLGQISTNTLEQARASRVSLVSSQETLNSNIQTCKLQLEVLVGAGLTGQIRLGGLPQVTGEQIQAMDLDRDLADAKKASYSLYEAKQTLDQAEEDFKDAGKKYNHNDKNYEYVQAQHTWQAAQHTYASTVRSFEIGLRTLCLKVKDNAQVLEAAKAALTAEQGNYAIAQLKYSQGSLSRNGLLEAEDKVKQAQETVDSAAVELFSSYNSYRWAVDHGILNT